MSIEAECSKCGKEISKKAAVIYGPPVRRWFTDPPDRELSPKDHLCIPCYKLLKKWIASTTRASE